MAVTITRTPWIDDDGTGTTGTVINNAVKTALYNDIDGALAKVAQLAGGNTFTGNQTIAGTLAVNGFGSHTFMATGAGLQNLSVANLTAGTGNLARISVGNDANANLGFIQALSSSFTSAAPSFANGITVASSGAGGLALAALGGALICYAGGSIERMRMTAAEVLVGAAVNPAQGNLVVTADGAVRQGFLAQNISASNQSLAFLYCLNVAGAPCGSVAQSGATTVVFNTTSDARLKDDAGRATDVAALRAVVVHDFAWKTDGRSDRGVFAQEAHAVFPRAVSVGTDDTTDDGHLARPWMTDYSKFVPDLIVGWQHHDADLAEIRALLTTLKGLSDAE